MVSKRSSRPIRLLSLALTAVLIGAAFVGAIGFGAGQGGTQEDETTVRVFHGVPDAGPVDVLVDGERVFTNVSYKNISEPANLSAGTHTITVIAVESEEDTEGTETPTEGNETATAVTETGTEETETPTEGEVIFEGSITLESDAGYTIALSGETSPIATTDVKPLLLRDNATIMGETQAGNATDGNETQAALRLVHLSPDAPAVDVVVNDTGEVLAENLTFRNHTGYLMVPAGNYTVALRPANQNDTGMNDTLGNETNESDMIATFNVSLEGGTANTAYVVGYVSPPGILTSLELDLVVVSDPIAEETETTPTTETETETGTPGTETETEPGTETGTETETETETGTPGTETETATETGSA